MPQISTSKPRARRGFAAMNPERRRHLQVVRVSAKDTAPPAEPTAADIQTGLKFDQKFRELPKEAGRLADGLASDARRMALEVRGTVFQQEQAKERIKVMRAQLDALETLL
jgi:hypothetical protein